MSVPLTTNAIIVAGIDRKSENNCTGLDDNVNEIYIPPHEKLDLHIDPVYYIQTSIVILKDQ